MDHPTSTNWYEVTAKLSITIFLLSLFIGPVSAQTYSSTSTVTISAIVIDPNSPPPPPPTSGGGGGGSTIGPDFSTGTDSAVFKGLAYPGSIVTLLKNGVIAAEVPASPNGSFEITLRNLRAGTYTFGILAEDKNRLKSTLDLYTVYIANGVSTQVEGIFIPPTITSDKLEVKRGDPIILLGTSAPNANITLLINSETQLTKRTTSNSTGAWTYKLDSLELEIGEHSAKGRAVTTDDISLFSELLAFSVGTVNRTRQAGSSTQKKSCDLNNDTRVNLLDFSILAYWYKRSGFPVKVDLTNDGKVDLADVSILAYCWTG
jgi:hypothetical protein